MRRVSIVVIVLLVSQPVSHAQAKAQGSAQEQKNQPYTIVESGPLFSMLQEKDPSKRIILLDGFVSRHPDSALLAYVYPSYCQAYADLKNYKKVMEYADKLSALGDEIGPGMRFNAAYVWIAAFNELNSKDPQLATKAREHIAEALKFLSEIQKPQNIDDQKWQGQKEKSVLFLQSVADKASAVLKASQEKRDPN